MGEETIFIHHGYNHVESGPAELVGMHHDIALLRLLFIPFMYAAPTYWDVVPAKKDEEFECNYAFDCPRAHGMNVEDLHEHGGRYAMVVDFEFSPGEGEQWFDKDADIMSTLAWPEEEGKPGRVYFATQSSQTPNEVIRILRERHPASRFELVHPV